jgi:hypothetical protein
VFVGWKSPLFTDSGADCPSYDATQPYEENCASNSVPLIFRVQIGKFLDDHSGGIIAIFTIILAVFTVRLAKATDKLVASANATAERQLRAYLYPDKFRRVERMGIQMVTAEVRNHGQTPAYDYRIRVHIAFAPFPYTGHDTGAAFIERSGGGAVPPGTGMGCDFHFPKELMTDEEIALVRRGERALWVVGSVTYRDAFGEPRWSNFRLYSTTTDWPVGAFGYDTGGYDSN